MDLNIKNPDSSTGQMMSGSQTAKVPQNDIAHPDEDTLQSAVVHLRKCITTQDAGYKLLHQKGTALEVLSAKSRSPDVKAAIEELLSVVSGLKNCRDSVIKAFNSVTQRVPKAALAPGAPTTDSSTQTEKYMPSTIDAVSQTPVSADDHSTAILSAIAEVKDIIAWTDTRVSEQQKQIQKLQRQQNLASRQHTGNEPDKRNVAKNKAKKKKSQGGSDAREPGKAVNTVSTDAVCGETSVPHNAQTETDSSSDLADDFTVVSRKTRKTKPVAPLVPPAIKHIRAPKHQAVIIEKPAGTTSMRT